MARFIVCGYMVRHPVGGNLYAYLHYVYGLRRLGHEVVYLEESGWAGSCYDPSAGSYGDDPRAGLGRVRGLLDEHGLDDVPLCYVERDRGEVHGAAWSDLKGWFDDADLLLNIGGVCWLPEFLAVRRRVLVDMDPLFTQLGRFAGEGREEYHLYLTYGANIGRPGCPIPTGGIDWRPAVPPVALELWPWATAGDAFTTVANWSAYGAVEFDGKQLGQKDVEFRRFIDLPGRTQERLELALSGVDDEAAGAMRAAGWALRDASDVAVEPSRYRAYIAGSKGEFSVAKQAYVETGSGWFSDRTVCYLAAGLPVVVQDTGFTSWLRSGRGVLAFSSASDAVESLACVSRAYDEHRRAAREIAARSFDYRISLASVVEAAEGRIAAASGRSEWPRT